MSKPSSTSPFFFYSFSTMPKPREEVDLASKLEDYLLKICSGEITGANASVNLAEGSVQVYSRKVQYLYNLVLHSLESLSQNRPEQSEGTSGSHAVSDEEEGTSGSHAVSDEEEGTSGSHAVSDEDEGTSGSHAVSDEEDDQFWCSDDVPVEANNSLDASTSEDASFYPFVKPPAANLVVLEGDCLDTSGDGGELESYQLATNDLYRDFILLDPCDSVAVDDFLKGDETGKVPKADYSVGVNEDGNHGFDMDDGCLEPENLEDSEDDGDNPGNSEDDDDNDGAQGICNLNLD